MLIHLALFVATHGQIEDQNRKNGEARENTLFLAAMHPELTMPPCVREFVTAFQQQRPGTRRVAQSPNWDVADAWDARFRLMDERTALQEEMDSLAGQSSGAQQTFVLEQYAFTPAHPKPLAYLTASFLHEGFAAPAREYVVSLARSRDPGRHLASRHLSHHVLRRGAAARQFHPWPNPAGIAPTLAASSAVAALIGAFLLRFPKTKIEVALVLGRRSLSNLAMGRAIRFKAAACWPLPLWLLMEIFSGAKAQDFHAARADSMSTRTQGGAVAGLYVARAVPCR